MAKKSKKLKELLEETDTTDLYHATEIARAQANLIMHDKLELIALILEAALYDREMNAA